VQRVEVLIYAFAGLVLDPLNIVMHGSETWFEIY